MVILLCKSHYNMWLQKMLQDYLDSEDKELDKDAMSTLILRRWLSCDVSMF